MKLNCDRNFTKIELLQESSNWHFNDCSQSQFFETLTPTKRKNEWNRADKLNE